MAIRIRFSGIHGWRATVSRFRRLQAYLLVSGLSMLGGCAATDASHTQLRDMTTAIDMVQCQPQDTGAPMIETCHGLRSGVAGLGSDVAPVKIFKFDSFSSTSSRFFSVNQLPLMKGDYINNGKVQLLHIDAPYIYIANNGSLAHRAARAANTFGKFWEMGDLLYQGQGAWPYDTYQRAHERFIASAVSLGIDKTAFTMQLDQGGHNGGIDSDRKLGIECGIGQNELSNELPIFILSIPKDRASECNLQKAAAAAPRSVQLRDDGTAYNVWVVGFRPYADFQRVLDAVRF